jgi:hypothetical protein
MIDDVSFRDAGGLCLAVIIWEAVCLVGTCSGITLVIMFIRKQIDVISYVIEDGFMSFAGDQWYQCWAKLRL